MKIFILLTAFSCLTLFSGIVSAQSLSLELEGRGVALPAGCVSVEDWFQPFMDQMGEQASIGWIADKMGDGAELVVHENVSGILVVFTEQESMGNIPLLQEWMGYEPMDGNGAPLYIRTVKWSRSKRGFMQ